MILRNVQKPHWLLIFALIFASTVSMMLLIIRYFYTDQFLFRFLAWNLFLAWLPFLFVMVVIMFPGKHYVTLLFGALWLLFFPNAPYMTTDLLHLWPREDVPVWYDMILLLSFALTGLSLGLGSLSLMQAEVSARFGRYSSWLFVGGALLLSGFGIYIGRFLRWNSWDVLTNPFSLWQDLQLTITTPMLFLKTAVVTLALTAVFSFTYLVMIALAQISPGRQTIPFE